MKRELEDIRITCKEDCGNAPKKKLLLEFNIALVKKDNEFIKDYISDDIYWNMIGVHNIKGRQGFLETSKQWMDTKPNELHIKNIITHGKTAAVTGNLKINGLITYEFSHIYEFSSVGKNAKINEITSYVIKV